MSCLLGLAIACSYTLVLIPIFTRVLFCLRRHDELLIKTVGLPPRPEYEDQDSVNWYEVNFDKGVLEITKTTGRKDNKVGKPKDKKQGTRFVVDHIFELQIITYAFDSKNKNGNDLSKKISDTAWQKAHDVVNGLEADTKDCNALAGKTSK